MALKFSPREREVIRLLATGLNFVEIGEVLGISQHTVRTYATQSRRKLHTTARKLPLAYRAATGDNPFP